MKSLKKQYPLRLMSLLCLFLFGLSGYGQNHISDIKKDGRTELTLVIEITPPKGKPAKTEIKKNTPIKSGTILEVPSKITVFITSSNGNIGQINGPNTVEFTATSTGEEYRVIEGSGTSNVILNVFKKLTGGVLASGPTGEIHARSKLTEFLVTVDGNNAIFELRIGKIDINLKRKIEIKDENKIDSISMRTLFITETTSLGLKDPPFPFNSDSVKTVSITQDNEIKKFLNTQLNQQKRTLMNSGSRSKQATKFLEKGSSVKGIELLEEAYNLGELRWDLILQSSLMLADAYLSKDDIKRSKAWLDAGLHFNEYFYKINQEKFDHYSQLGNNKITKAFGHDLIVANDFSAWAYTLKLKINGCLENGNENPSKYRRDANQLKKEIANY